MNRRIGHGGRLLLLALTAALAGCRHKPAPAVPIPPPTTVPVASPPPSTARIPAIPAPKPPLTTVTVPAKKVRKPRKKIVAALPPQLPAPPLVVPPVPPPPAAAPAALGTLTLGESGSNARQEAESAIASLERRLASLPAELVRTQREQVGRVEHFAEQARSALKGGDAEGAQTLATKGKLILDDLLK